MSIHPGFVSLRELCPDLVLEMSYATTANFTGEVVPGYLAREAYLGRPAGEALARVQASARAQGLCLKIFDAYRPTKAVAFFQEWARRSEDQLELKAKFYPDFSREELFGQGYIALRSSHSRGCAVDLTLVDARGVELDMGTCFDYFHESSMTDASSVSEGQRKNRMLLKAMMEAEGFRNYAMEWWHFSFRPEPFPDQYFDFDVV